MQNNTQFPNAHIVMEARKICQHHYALYLRQCLMSRFGQTWWEVAVEQTATPNQSNIDPSGIERIKQTMRDGTPDDWFNELDFLAHVKLLKHHWGNIRELVDDASLISYTNTAHKNRKFWAHDPVRDISRKDMKKIVRNFSNILVAIAKEAEANTVLALIDSSSTSPETPSFLQSALVRWLGWTVVVIGIVAVGMLLLPNFIREIIDPNPSVSIQSGSVNGSRVSFIPQINDPALQITGYLWDFGDGKTSTEINPTYQYGATGTYTVSLLVTGQGFNINSRQLTVEISDVIPNRACDTDAPTGGLNPDGTLAVPDFRDDLMKRENPIIVLTREEDYLIQNEIFKALDSEGFFSIEPRMRVDIQKSPKVAGAYLLDCASMASLAEFLKSFIVIAPELISVEDLGNNSDGFPLMQATIQVVVYDPYSAQQLYRNRETVPRFSNTKLDAEQTAIEASAELLAQSIVEAIKKYYK